MTAEIATRKVGTKWHGYIDGRPDLDETALSEEAVRRKMEQLRDRLGVCSSRTRLFGGRTCELIKGHHVLGKTRIEHRSGGVSWMEDCREDRVDDGEERPQRMRGRRARGR